MRKHGAKRWGLLLGGVLRVVVTVPFFVVVVVMPLGLALLALAMPDDAESGAFAYPQVRTLPIGGDEVLRLALNRLRSALTHHDGGEGGEADASGEADEQGLGTRSGLVH